eukprot:GHUV01030863.1.p1 GENE.GHUV01030863.1~~GHUV01030863.1.p1  ORF type:complete len:235 (+),score=91.91 GHUV01030863.1:234-938(+)
MPAGHVEAMSASTSQLQAGPLAASLAEEKRARKQAEDDALRLYNRIRQLEKEEGRADRRIKDSKQKTASIHEQQQQLLEHLSEMQQREAEAKEQLERQWQENQQLKQQNEQIKQQAAARLLAEKAQSAAETKEQRAELAAELEQFHASRLAAVAAKKQAVKQKEQHGAAKLQQYKATKQLTVSLASVECRYYGSRVRAINGIRFCRPHHICCCLLHAPQQQHQVTADTACAAPA